MTQPTESVDASGTTRGGSRLGRVLFIIGGIATVLWPALIVLLIFGTVGLPFIAAIAAAGVWGTYRGARGYRLARLAMGIAGVLVALIVLGAPATGNTQYLFGWLPLAATVGAFLLRREEPAAPVAPAVEPAQGVDRAP